LAQSVFLGVGFGQFWFIGQEKNTSDHYIFTFDSDSGFPVIKKKIDADTFSNTTNTVCFSEDTQSIFMVNGQLATSYSLTPQQLVPFGAKFYQQVALTRVYKNSVPEAVPYLRCSIFGENGFAYVARQNAGAKSVVAVDLNGNLFYKVQNTFASNDLPQISQISSHSDSTVYVGSEGKYHKVDSNGKLTSFDLGNSKVPAPFSIDQDGSAISYDSFTIVPTTQPALGYTLSTNQATTVIHENFYGVVAFKSTGAGTIFGLDGRIIKDVPVLWRPYRDITKILVRNEHVFFPDSIVHLTVETTATGFLTTTVKSVPITDKDFQ